ncbi:SpoIIIAH-like family protein [Gorillibacterium massiliense]|uniref:SpoIIIAH-like family protein n=1 Tax=Gorillibacterium massiliense TaxID=1280390 RepID=UPI0004B0E018|nr:SpoIIIAH-like family protein [Gorillibacterium massiliense]
MNSKRQTIWLVSMLSLMVVLSAYYLFTEDSSKLNSSANQTVTDGIQTDSHEVGTDASTTTTGSKGQVDSSKDSTKNSSKDSSKDSSKGTQADSKSASSVKNSAGDQATSGKASGELTDSQILDQLNQQNASGSDFFSTSVDKRSADVDNQVSSLQAAIDDPKAEPASIAKSYTEMDQITNLDAKQKNLEAALMDEGFEQAVVLKENNKFKVIVQTDKLEKSEAVSIIDRVVNELNIQPGQVSVQFRAQ